MRSDLCITFLTGSMLLLSASCFILVSACLLSSYQLLQASLVAQLVNNLPAVWETWVRHQVGKIPWRWEQLPTPVFWLGKLHGIYSPWGRKELDTTEQLSLLPKTPGHGAGQNTLVIRVSTGRDIWSESDQSEHPIPHHRDWSRDEA